jgi:hypothetical protein
MYIALLRCVQTKHLRFSKVVAHLQTLTPGLVTASLNNPLQSR